MAIPVPIRCGGAGGDAGHRADSVVAEDALDEEDACRTCAPRPARPGPPTHARPRRSFRTAVSPTPKGSQVVVMPGMISQWPPPEGAMDKDPDHRHHDLSTAAARRRSPGTCWSRASASPRCSGAAGCRAATRASSTAPAPRLMPGLDRAARPRELSRRRLATRTSRACRRKSTSWSPCATPRRMLDCGYTSVLVGGLGQAAARHRHPQRDQRRPHPRAALPGQRSGDHGHRRPRRRATRCTCPTWRRRPSPGCADGPDEIRKVCRLLVREGADLLKLNVSGRHGTAQQPLRSAR